MNSVGPNCKNIVNRVGTFIDSVVINENSWNNIGRNSVSYEYSWDEQCFCEYSPDEQYLQ